MSRTFEAIDLVNLPQLSAADAMTLSAALVARAHALAPLPMSIGRSLGLVESALDELRQAVRRRLGDGSAEGIVVSAVDRLLEAAWAAGYAWCNGWRRLPGQGAINAKAERLYDLLYADSVAVVGRRDRQWIESQERLALVEEHGLEATFNELGGQVILDTIRSVHECYGQNRGLMDAAGRPSPTVGECRGKLLDAVRRHVIRVAAYVEPGDAESAALARSLLAPLREWQRRLASGNPEGNPDGNTDGNTDGNPERPRAESGKPAPTGSAEQPAGAPQQSDIQSDIPAPMSNDLTIRMPGIDGIVLEDDERTLQ